MHHRAHDQSSQLDVRTDAGIAMHRGVISRLWVTCRKKRLGTCLYFARGRDLGQSETRGKGVALVEGYAGAESVLTSRRVLEMKVSRLMKACCW
jgi:hypothetical protein